MKETPYNVTSTNNSRHIFTKEEEEKAFQAIRALKKSDRKKRMRSVYGKVEPFETNEEVIELWNRFKETELEEYLKKTGNFTASDILRIGIDRFLYALGITKKGDVSAWRDHKVSLCVCPSCDSEFTMFLFDVNAGLCRECSHDYSFDAIKAFIDRSMREAAEDSWDKEKNAPDYARIGDIVMNFTALFHNDKNLRNLFLKDSPFAKKLVSEQEG